MSRDVTELPLWLNCPYRDRVPPEIEIRKGSFASDEDELIVFWWPKFGLHVDCTADEESLVDFRRMGEPALANLVGAVFEKTYPNMFSTMIREYTQYKAGNKPFPEELRLQFEYYKHLDEFIGKKSIFQLPGLN